MCIVNHIFVQGTPRAESPDIGTTASESTGPAGQGMAEHSGRRRRGHRVAPGSPSASASSTGFSRGCILSPRRPHGSPLPRVQRPRPGGDPARRRWSSPSSTKLRLPLRPRSSGQDSVDVGRRQGGNCENTWDILCRRLLLTEPAPASLHKPSSAAFTPVGWRWSSLWSS